MTKKWVAPPLWREELTGWLAALKAGGRSEQTLLTRRRKMTYTAVCLGVSPYEVTCEMMTQWFASQSWKPETRKAYRNTVSSFFAWMRQTGRRNDDASMELPKVKRPRAHPRPCPDKVILAALGRASESERIMLRLGAECGLRRGEIGRVSSGDVVDDLVGRSLVVNGKGDKQRIVPLPDDLADLISACDGYVFPGRFGGHVEESYIGDRLSSLLGDGWTAHSLRHRYATATWQATHDLLLVSKLLGHASVETTQVYVAMPDERLRAGMAAVLLSA